MVMIPDVCWLSPMCPLLLMKSSFSIMFCCFLLVKSWLYHAFPMFFHHVSTMFQHVSILFHHVPSLFPCVFFMVCPCLSISFHMFPTCYHVFEGFAHVFPQPSPYCQLIGLREKLYRKPPYFMGKSMKNRAGFRLRFSLQLIHWKYHLEDSHRPWTV